MEITSNGKTVWVNDDEGVCLGRFSRFGIDVHKDFAGQVASDTQCLDCKAGPVNREDWERFKAGMLSFHNVTVDDSHMPGFLNG